MTQDSKQSTSTNSVSLDELSALCDQMVSLSRAGVPLDQGLIRLARDLPGRLASQAKRVGEQLKSGKSLADVVAEDDGPFPAIYRHVVEAGIRSGRLTVALQGFARLARQLSELRQLVLSALVYPILLLVLLVVICLTVVRRLGPTLAQSFADLRPYSARGDWTSQFIDQYAYWCQWFWLLPVLVFGLAAFWFVAARRARSTGRGANWMHWIPGAGRLLRYSRLQAFTEVLSLLIQQQVPLDQSLRLAGSVSGAPDIDADACRLADQIARGESLAQNTDEPKGTNDTGIPPLVRWSLLHAQQTGKLETALDRATETYRRRASLAAEWLRKTLPIIFTLSLGGIVSLFYAAMVLVPWFTVMHSLSDAMEAL